jgi:hypothetical protein
MTGRPPKRGHITLTEGGKIVWSLNPSQRLGLMVTDRNFLLYSLTLESTSHLWSFTVAHSNVGGHTIDAAAKTSGH